jgi:outer membrane usher protein
VYVNNQKTFSQKINPGPFDITHLPVPGNGAGQVNLVVKDILGNEQIISKNFYQSPILLAKGENDFSLESGFLRKNYGTKSNDYQDGFAAGTLAAREGAGALNLGCRVEFVVAATGEYSLGV